MVPESYDQLPEGMVEAVFHRITDLEIKAPVTRDLVVGDYDLNCGQQDIDYRLLSVPAATDDTTGAALKPLSMS